MSRVLLDTHVLLWVVGTPDRLGRGCRRLLESASTIHHSAISHVELRLKEQKGKGHLPTQLPERLRAQGLIPLPFHDTHAEEFARFGPLAGTDPFDQMLLAQATAEVLTFATADLRLLSLGLDRVVDATQ